MSSLFTVVVPTRNRADVLYAALSTCIAQNDLNFEILISDNASEDDTAKVACSFDDSRVRYVRTETPLGMPEHWDFALSKVRAGFVSVLGDDDGLAPDAVSIARRILESGTLRCLTWRKAEYHWPDYTVPAFRNWLQVPLRADTEIYEPNTVLAEVLNFTRTYTDLPCIYNSFVATSLIDKIRETSAGRLFPCVNPDIYSGFALSAVAGNYAFSHRPLSINAASRYSNGTATVVSGPQSESNRQHLRQTSQKLDATLVICPCIPVYIADAALTAQRNFKFRWPEINWPAMFRLSLQDAEVRTPEVYASAISGLRIIAARRQCEKDFQLALASSVYRGVQKQPNFGISHGKQTLEVDGTNLGIRSVLEASQFVGVVGKILAEKRGRAFSKRRLSRYVIGITTSRLRDFWLDQLLLLNDPPYLSPPARVIDRVNDAARWGGSKIRSVARRVLSLISRAR